MLYRVRMYTYLVTRSLLEFANNGAGIVTSNQGSALLALIAGLFSLEVMYCLTRGHVLFDPESIQQVIAIGVYHILC